MREGGLRTTRGTVMPTMQAIASAAARSSTRRSACVRPTSCSTSGASRFELEQTSRADLDPHYDAVGEFLGIAPTPEAVQGRRNLLFREGCEALGYFRAGRRATCAAVAAAASASPVAARAPSSRWTSATCRRRCAPGRGCSPRRGWSASSATARAPGVAGTSSRPSPGGEPPLPRGRGVVVLAAGCMATPVLLQKSGDLANRSGQVGRNLQFHPGVAVSGVFPERVDPHSARPRATSRCSSCARASSSRRCGRRPRCWRCASRASGTSSSAAVAAAARRGLGRDRELQPLARARARPPRKQPRPEAALAPAARGRADPGPGALRAGRALLRGRRPHGHARRRGHPGGDALARRGADPAQRSSVPPIS